MPFSSRTAIISVCGRRPTSVNDDERTQAAHLSRDAVAHAVVEDPDGPPEVAEEFGDEGEEDVNGLCRGSCARTLVSSTTAATRRRTIKAGVGERGDQDGA